MTDFAIHLVSFRGTTDTGVYTTLMTGQQEPQAWQLDEIERYVREQRAKQAPPFEDDDYL